jgi:hypothetical protein
MTDNKFNKKNWTKEKKCWSFNKSSIFTTVDIDGNLSDNLKKISWLKLKMTLKYEKIDCQKKQPL